MRKKKGRGIISEKKEGELFEKKGKGNYLSCKYTTLKTFQRLFCFAAMQSEVLQHTNDRSSPDPHLIPAWKRCKQRKGREEAQPTSGDQRCTRAVILYSILFKEQYKQNYLCPAKCCLITYAPLFACILSSLYHPQADVKQLLKASFSLACLKLAYLSFEKTLLPIYICIETDI